MYEKWSNNKKFCFLIIYVETLHFLHLGGILAVLTEHLANSSVHVCIASLHILRHTNQNLDLIAYFLMYVNARWP